MRILVPTVFFLLSWPLASTAYKEGPFPNMTGGFGDKTCHSCHFDNPVNAPGGMLTVTGVPSTYAAAETYDNLASDMEKLVERIASIDRAIARAKAKIPVRPHPKSDRE